MAKRKSLSKKIRFEVFKRDSFTCQYCGKSAPTVVLHVDHITPVKEGGTNDITNLITACADCNLGKGARKLSDTSEVMKAKKQLDELNARREQLEMMLQWKKGLSNIEEQQVDAIAERFNSFSGFKVNENGRRKIKKWLKDFGFSEIYDCIEISCDQYLKATKGGNSHSSVEKAFSYIPRIAYNKKRDREHPEYAELFYIRGILKNRMPLNSAEWYDAILYMEKALANGVETETIKNIAMKSDTFMYFLNALEGEYLQ
jgi:hypothetical protein